MRSRSEGPLATRVTTLSTAWTRQNPYRREVHPPRRGANHSPRSCARCTALWRNFQLCHTAATFSQEFRNRLVIMPLTSTSRGPKMGSPQGGKATTVTVRFLDDEIMEGQVGAVDLDQPNIELEMPDEASNNERARIPLPAIKRITLTAGQPTPDEQSRAGKKGAIRFQDGE